MTFPKPDFPPEAIAAAKAAAQEAYPNESCGLIVKGVYAPCKNIAKDPKEGFEIDPQAIITAGKDLQCVLHSHPDGPAEPSAADQQGQIDTACIWGIMVSKKIEVLDPLFWGDYRLDEPLIGRQFIHGVSDCGSLIRAYFWQTQGILIQDFPRDLKWWKEDKDIYTQSYAAAGFVPVEAKDLKDGDIFLGMVLSDVPNHGGIILSVNQGLVLHHLEKRLSRREPLLPWQKYVRYWLRYKPTTNTSAEPVVEAQQ